MSEASGQARGLLMGRLQAAVRSWAVSQTEAARRLSVSQPRVNDLLQGRIERFSLDALFDLAVRAGLGVSIASASAAGPPGTREAPASYRDRTAKRARRRTLRLKEARSRTPRCFVIAGPNGCGKTTFAREYLPREAGTVHFVNADLIAGGLSPLRPSQAALAAGRVVLTELDRLATAREDFAFESTLSGLAYLGRLTDWKRAGYFIKIVFLRLDSPELALKRIAARVLQGGHDVPRVDVLRRFGRSLENFGTRYRLLADEWELYDNSAERPRLIEVGP